MITPAEVVWPLAGLALVAVIAIIWLSLRAEDAIIPTVQVGHSIERTAAGSTGRPVAALGWAGLAAEATRTDTLLWYASRVLDGGRL